ncbi:MAG: hypothetical protein E6G10_08325 [Actinobacteria bacterium]|nr:MAG: hypothetical protein E6G10_08325 [Actinomycetota bacterium]
MRLLELAALGGFVLACAAIGRAIWSRAVAQRAAPDATWAPYHRFEGSCRRVYVRRGHELEPVGEVAAGDDDYDERFLLLMARARERAAVLNSER